MGSIKVARLSADDFRHHVDNSTSTIQKLYQLYQDPVLSDLQLIVGGKSFYAHKLILSISSDVFKTMLTNPTWPEAYTDKIYLEEEPQCGLVFEDFLQYLYTGKIRLSHTSVLPVLILADKYNISDLSSVCVEYMCSHFIASKSESSVLSWLDYSTMCNQKNLEKHCDSYIKSNFQFIMETDEFLTISSDMLLKLLNSSDIVITNEISLFQYVLKWVQKNIIHAARKGTLSLDELSLMKHIVSLIRYNLISREDVMLLSVSTKEAIDHLQNLTGTKLLPHTVSCIQNTQGSLDEEELSKLDSDESKQQNVPRIYTCDAWCTEMVVPNVRFVQPGEIYGAFFSTPRFSNMENEESWDWHIDLHPRGVLFRGCMMIGHYGNHSIDEVIYERVRLAVTSNIRENRSVKVTVLVYGHQHNVEYIAKALTKICMFTEDTIIHHINDLIDYNEFNNEQSPFLLGEDQNSFKIKIIIQPI